uniref:Cytochrome c oxidase subunit 3 n=1 Tax=Choreocolax polysiphoniae TaxID=282351 RepID=A0A1J0F7A4_9FLOR|nr:cytochrome c oxidase subunit 3 [Choreocolax polysiphoniae]APC24873.1 cytochrome c oxidase subunit 3 [Choreocolax polysiphoniae]
MSITKPKKLKLILINKIYSKHPFHLVDPSPWPFLASWSSFICVISTVSYFHLFNFGKLFLIISFIFLIIIMFFWWRDVLRESNYEGYHTGLVQQGLRFGIILFLISEIFFFLAFFLAFFHVSVSPSIEIGSIWPPRGIYVLNPWQVPFLNTLILLLSGCTITWCHHTLVSNLRYQFIISLILTIILALTFTFFQIYEYKMANFRLSDGIYGSTFYLITGFHGFHVVIGTIFLIISFIRFLKFELTQQHHFGFESSIWYWHFVDVIWLFLFVSIYWWGGV